jgi:Tol biopolymer transport system component
MQHFRPFVVQLPWDGTDSGAGSSGIRYSVDISADGRFVTFDSEADDLVAKDSNDTSDIFVRDLQNGTTTLVSANKNGTDSGAGSSGDINTGKISADGRFVVFDSKADDLVAKDTNGKSDLFVRDLQNGTTTLISVNKDGKDSGSGSSHRPKISADGRFVAFVSTAGDLVATKDTNDQSDVFVRDLQSGTTTLVSINKKGTSSGNGSSFHPQISADGRFVAFDSKANDLVVKDTNRKKDVFVFEVFQAP